MSFSALSHALSPCRSSVGIVSTPWWAPSTIPMATARDALSPPTMAFALIAAVKSSVYLRMMYTDEGSVPSVGLAFPT